MASNQFSVDRLQLLLQQCLQYWSVSGKVDRYADAGYRLAGVDFEIVVDRCADTLPFRWSVRMHERTRTASSISGLLRHVRQMLDVPVASMSMSFAQPVASTTLSTQTIPSANAETVSRNVIADGDNESENDQRKIPVTVLTGYLGSGKTTLLADLLTLPSFTRTAVIVNEFGEIGIDHDLIETSDESTVQLTTGCLCCLAQDELGLTLADLLRRRDRGEIKQFDRVVIETSGLADPVPIVQSLMRHPLVSRHYGFERVVTTVDVLTATSVVDRDAEFVSQIALADRIILTKTDVAGPASERLLQSLRHLNHVAPFTDRWQGENVVEKIVNGEKQQLDFDATDDAVNQWASLHEADVHHADRVQSVCLVRDEPIAAIAITLFLESLAEHFGFDLLRLKGLIRLRENPSRPYVIQGVQHVFHAPMWRERWPDSDRRTRLVLLGRNLYAPLIELLLDSIIDEVDAVSARDTKVNRAEQDTGDTSTHSPGIVGNGIH